MPKSCIVAQSNPGGRPAMLIILCVCCAFAELAVSPENVPTPIKARKTPVRTTNSPIKTRILKNADCEVDFCFIVGVLTEFLVFASPRLMAIAKAVNSFLTFSRNASQELVTNLLLCSHNARQRSVAIFAARTVRQHEFTAPQDS